MEAVSKAQRWAALVMLLVLLLATTSGLAPPVTVNADDPPISDDGDTLQQPGAVTGSTEAPATPNTRAPEEYEACATPYVAIPDNDPAGVTSQMSISSLSYIGDLNISVDVDHTWVGDLVLTVEHVESGTSVTIVNRPPCSGDNIVATLDDEAASPVDAECEPAVPTISGSFKPSNPLSAFRGRNAKGTWRLTVSDQAALDVGTLNQWCVVGIAEVAYAVDSDASDHLWMIDLDSGDSVDIGPVGFGSVEALGFSPDGTLYGVDDVTEELITIDLTTGAGAAVGSLGVAVNDVGLAFDVLGRLWMVDDGTQNLYRVSPSNGHATLIGALGQQVTGLAARGMQLFGLGGDGTNNLVTINTTTGAATPVGPLVNVSLSDGGLDFDAFGTLWGITDSIPGTVFRIDAGTGLATLHTTTSGVGGIENLAIPPAPVAYAVDSDDADHLWMLYLNIGIVIDVGPVGYGSVEALAFSPEGTLYGVDDDLDQLLTIDLSTGAGSTVGSLGVNVADVGLAFDWAGNLWMVDDYTRDLYSVDSGSGAATRIGFLGQEVTGLTAHGGTLYGLGGDNKNNLVTIDTATGAAVSVGPLVNVTVQNGGLAFDMYGTLWGISNTNPDTIFTVNPATGKALAITEVLGARGYESMAMLVPLHRVYLPLVLRAY